MIYLVDTNIIADWLVNVPSITLKVQQTLEQSHILGICQPVIYEVERGFRWRAQPRKEQIFREKILPRLNFFTLQDEDWMQAARFWGELTSKGRQLSDVDFLLAALAYRLNATIASSDSDFDPLPVRRENWRE
jgi:predicted nucleic acid-binding protein